MKRFANIDTEYTPMIEQQCRILAEAAKQTAFELLQATTAQKNAWLHGCAKRINNAHAELIETNERDLAAAPDFGLNDAAIDRLRLTPTRLDAIANGLKQVAELPDPIGEIFEASTRPNDLQVHKVRVPLGVIFFIYESRPNVTVDAAALCVKSGNAVILRGGKEAFHTNHAFHHLLQDELKKHDLPTNAVSMVPMQDRDAVGILLRMNDCIDLVIPRGGKGLIRRIAEEATMPVLKHYDGNCHVYVHASADLPMAERIILNAKCQRPGVCNAAEGLLVDAAIAETFLPHIGKLLQDNDVEIRGCEETLRLLPNVIAASDEDYRTEFLDLILSVKVVKSISEAIDHINEHGSKHTDAIIAQDAKAIHQFQQSIDTAAVVVNASTRFNDGFELGLGAEIGISTDKFHARGPCGLRELTSYKWSIIGTGQVRE